MRRLTESEKDFLTPYIPQVDLEKAEIFEAQVPRWLRKKYIAITLESRIYIRGRIYDAGLVSGLALLAHELVHVGQYRAGMTRLKYLWASRRGYGRNPYEAPAYAKEKEVLKRRTNGPGC